MGNSSNKESTSTNIEEKHSIENDNKEIIYTVHDPLDTIRKRAEEIERELLPVTNLKLDEEICYEDVYFNFHGRNYLHTLRCGLQRPNKETFVLLHGFQGCSLTFYRLCPLLYPIFNLYCPDLIGMGLSSRPEVTFTDSLECIDYFVDSIEAWREVMNLESFILAGHSMGGYFACAYALKYPSRVKKMILLAPAGITDATKGGSIHENTSLAQKVGFRFIPSFWTFQPTLQGTYVGLIKPMLKFGLRMRYTIPKIESELTAQITECALEYPPDLDRSIYQVFSHPFPSATYPLEDTLYNELKVKCDIIYGENDWMDRVGCKRLCEKDGERFKIFLLPNSGHTFPIECPEELAKLIIANMPAIDKNEEEEEEDNKE